MSVHSNFFAGSKEKMLRKALLGGAAAVAMTTACAPSSAWAVNCVSAANGIQTTGGSVGSVGSGTVITVTEFAAIRFCSSCYPFRSPWLSFFGGSPGRLRQPAHP